MKFKNEKKQENKKLKKNMKKNSYQSTIAKWFWEKDFQNHITSTVEVMIGVE